MTARCDECGKVDGSVRTRTRVDENLREHRRQLCGRCGEKLGYRSASYDRGPLPRWR